MGERFRNPIVVQGAESLDHRIFNEFTYRDFPLPLRWCPADNGGHQNAVSVGTFDEAHLATAAEHKEFNYTGGGQLWIGEGEYLDGVPEAEQAAIRARAGVAFLSVDPGAATQYRTSIRDADGKQVDPADVEDAYMAVFMGDDEDGSKQDWLASLYELAEFDTYHVGAITQIDIPCFPECRVMLPEATAEPRVAASGSGSTDAARSARRLLRRVAAGPATRPAEWFAPRTYDRYTPWTITDEGRIMGHLAGWNACHRAHTARCEKPDYQTTFDEFHTGWVALDNGERLRVGVITHVDGHLNTAAEYDRVASDPACQIGVTRLHADKWGIQMSGAVHPDVGPEQIARALASAPSGDWRGPAGARRLFGIALVNTPGYTAYIEDDGQGTQRLVASIPAPPAVPGVEPSAASTFFEIPTSKLAAACACEATSHVAYGGGEDHAGLIEDCDTCGALVMADAHPCGCGGHEGACTCHEAKVLTPAELLALAQLDEAHRLQSA